MSTSRTFRERLESAPSYGYGVITIQGDQDLMMATYVWALEQRSAGIHMGIFLTKDGLTVHTPLEHYKPPLPFKSCDNG